MIGWGWPCWDAACCDCCAPLCSFLQDKPKPKKASKAAAPPTLDDAASWPSIGGAVAPAAAKAAEPEEAEEEAEAEAEAEPEAEGKAEEEEPAAAPAEEEKEEEVAAAAEPEEEAVEEEAAAPAAPAASADGHVTVKLEVAADGTVALALSA